MVRTASFAFAIVDPPAGYRSLVTGDALSLIGVQQFRPGDGTITSTTRLYRASLRPAG